MESVIVVAFFLLVIGRVGEIADGYCEPPLVRKGESYPLTSYTYGGSLEDCACSSTDFCLRKCCDEGYVANGSVCVRNDSAAFKSIDVHKDKHAPARSVARFRVVPGLMSCSDGYYLLELDEDRFLLQEDGRLWQVHGETYIDRNDYCLDYFNQQDLSSALRCFPHVSRFPIKLNFIGMIISLPFLLATFLVYAFLPNRNLHGKALMCFVAALFVAYLLLVVIQSRSAELRAGCIIAAISCYFFFVVSFFWMNVMSIDIWWTFSGMRDFSGNKRQTERRRFLLFSLYAWGVPLLFSVIVVILNVTVDPDAWYSPGLGKRHCWFHGDAGTLLYFYGPIAAIIITNVVLFAMTALRIKKMQNESAVLRTAESKTHNECEKRRFKLYIRLLLAMGLNWLMEIISFLVEWKGGKVSPAVWYVTDLCNALYGVIIFFLFAFKKKIWKELRARYFETCGRRQSNKRTHESSVTTIESVLNN